MASELQTLDLSPWQTRALAVPAGIDLVLGGGRGGGKTHLLNVLALRTALTVPGCRVLIVRKSYPSLADLVSQERALFPQARGSFNSNEHTWSFPNGSQIELAFLESEVDLDRLQGRSFVAVMVDESGQFSSPRLLDLLLANLRAAPGVETRRVLACNPGGVGHQFLARRYCLTATPWIPTTCPDTGRLFVYCPSVATDNPYLNVEVYRENLRAACSDDAELLSAWEFGSWAVLRGAFFGDVLDEKRVALDPSLFCPEWLAERLRSHRPVDWAAVETWCGLQGVCEQASRSPWRTWVCGDWGSSAPCYFALLAQSPGAEVGGKWISRGSLVALDEFVAANPDNDAEGLRWPTDRVAAAVATMCEKWGVRPVGVLDSSAFAITGSAAGSIGAELNSFGLNLSPGPKGSRIHGLQKLRTLFANAGASDVPGLYLSRRCAYAWRTLPTLPRDRRDPSDTDPAAPDHALDALRYGILWQPHYSTIQ